MGAESLLFGHGITDPLHKVSIISGIKENDTLREDLLTCYPPIIGFLFAFFKLRLFLLDFVAFSVEFLRLIQENFLCLFVCAWEPIKNVASVAAVILCKSDAEDLEEKLVWEPHLELLAVDLLRLALVIAEGLASFFYLGDERILDLLYLRLDLLS